MSPSRDQRFPRTARLTRPAEFQRVFAGRFKSSDRHLLVAACPSDRQRPRLGLAISRKVSPRATVRNRIKRIIRDCFRHEQATLAPLDFVVVGRPGLPDIPAEQLRSALVHHWKTLSQRLCEAS